MKYTTIENTCLRTIHLCHIQRLSYHEKQFHHVGNGVIVEQYKRVPQTHVGNGVIVEQCKRVPQTHVGNGVIVEQYKRVLQTHVGNGIIIEQYKRVPQTHVGNSVIVEQYGTHAKNIPKFDRSKRCHNSPLCHSLGKWLLMKHVCGGGLEKEGTINTFSASLAPSIVQCR